MISPDQDLKDFPPWIWPYIRNAELAESKLFAKLRMSGEVAFESQPQLAQQAHLALIVQAVGMKVIAGHMPGDAGRAVANAADGSIAEYIDDFCGTPPGKHPPLPHIRELASQLAVLAATFAGDKIGQEFGKVSRSVAERAR